MNIEPIKTDGDYRRTLAEIEGLMTAERDTPEGDRLDVLVTLVEAWEAQHYPIDLPDSDRRHPLPHGAERTRAEGPCPLYRGTQSGLRGVEPQAVAEPQDDLALAPGTRHTRRVADQVRRSGAAGCALTLSNASVVAVKRALRSANTRSWGIVRPRATSASPCTMSFSMSSAFWRRWYTR